MNLRNPSPFLENLFRMPYMAQYPKVILAAIDNDIFSGLETPKAAEQLAKDKGLHRENTQLLLEALFSMGYLERTDCFYKNTSETSCYLVSGKDEYVGGFLKFFGTNMGGSFPDDISKLVKNGPTPMQQTAGEVAMPDFAALVEKMRECQEGYRQKEFITILKEIPQYHTAKSMLDLGCGSGMFSLAVAKERPDMAVTLFDIPAMKAGIEESIAITGTEQNTRVIGGDFLKDDLDGKYDIIVAICSMGFAKHDIDYMVKKIYNSLNKGGIYINLQEGILLDRSAPTDQVLGWLGCRMEGMNVDMEKGMITKAAEKAGFQNISKETLMLSASWLDLDIMRK